MPWPRLADPFPVHKLLLRSQALLCLGSCTPHPSELLAGKLCVPGWEVAFQPCPLLSVPRVVAVSRGMLKGTAGSLCPCWGWVSALLGLGSAGPQFLLSQHLQSLTSGLTHHLSRVCRA